MKIDFLTPVNRENSAFVNAVDQLFYFGGRQAYHIKKTPGDSSNVEMRDAHVSSFKVALKVMICFTVVVPIFCLIVKIIDRNLHSYRASAPFAKEVRNVLVISISAGPTHFGHMAMIALAIEERLSKGIKVEEVVVTLAHESYFRSKCQKYKPGIIALYREDRIKITELVIEAAKEMFNGVAVRVLEDEDASKQDHPYMYRKVAASKSCPVHLVVGKDLYNSMHSFWDRAGSSHVASVIVIDREMVGQQPTKVPQSNPKYTFIDPKDPKHPEYSKYAKYASLSSTAIRNGDAELPPHIQTYFKGCKSMPPSAL